MKHLLALVFLLALLPAEAHAATSITSPSGGECLKAGTTLALSWTQDPSSSHSYSSIWLGGNQPTYANGQDPIIGGHFASSPLSWTLPNVTQGGYQLYVESHSGSHSNISTALSGKFSIDSTGPSTPIASTGSVSDSSITINWGQVSDPGCEGLRGYKLYRNNSLIYSGTGTSYADSGLNSQTTYSYHLKAFDDFATTSGNTISVTTAAPAQSPTNTTTNPEPTPTSAQSPTNTTANPEPASALNQQKATGSLKCTINTDTTATLKYSFAHASNATLFQSSLSLNSYSTPSGSGNYTVAKLEPQTKYEFILRNGKVASSPLLATTACTTLAASAEEPTQQMPTSDEAAESTEQSVTAMPVNTNARNRLHPLTPLAVGISLVVAAGGGWWIFRMRQRIG